MNNLIKTSMFFNRSLAAGILLSACGLINARGQQDELAVTNEFTTAWKELNTSEAKQHARELFNQRKFGMFIHWGLYSIPGGIWKGEKMEDGGTGPKVAEWVMRRKKIPRAEYAELAKLFNPTKFNADEWVAVAKAAGMKYIVITSKHHDGFALFDSKVDDFNVVKATPFGRDVIRELETACKKAGLAFGVYYSHSLDWRDGGDGGMKTYGPEKNPKYKLFPNYFDPAPVSFDDYIAGKSLPQVRELVNNYDLAEIWLDTPIYIPAKYSFMFYKEIYNANPEILVTMRVGNGMGDIDTPGDNTIPDESSENCWEGIATLNNSWGYKSYDHDWKSQEELIYWLVANVSKGGDFLLNVGPTGEGVIPPESVENLRKVGEWLAVNGDAVYDSKPWNISHEGPTRVEMKGTEHRQEEGFSLNFTSDDFWFTKKTGKIYVIALVRPQNGAVTIKSLKDIPVSSVRVLGEEGAVQFKQTEEGLCVKLPVLKNTTHGYALEVL